MIKIKKLILYFIMIPVCILALYCMWCSLNYKVKTGYFYNSSFMFLYFIFFIMCIGNIYVHFFAGILSINDNKLSFKSLFYSKTNHILMKIIKPVSYILISIYFISFFSDININDYYGAIWNLLAIIVTIFYLIWFEASFKIKSCKKLD